MKDKFTKEVVWHNCATYPPSEVFNSNLFVTSGAEVFAVVYHRDIGWRDKDSGGLLPPQCLDKYWWADLDQTMCDFTVEECLL